MFKTIVSSSLYEVAENYKLVRVAFVTTFLHTIISLITVANYFTNILIYNVGVETEGARDTVMLTMTSFLREGYIFEIIILVFLFFIGYFFVYPVGMGVMISYLREKSVGKATLHGLKLFAPLAIIHGAMALVTISGQTIGIYMRIIAASIADSRLVQAVMVMIGLVILSGTILLPYAIYVVAIEDISGNAKEQSQKALKISAGLAMENFRITVKFSLLSLVLQMRIIFNIAVLVFIPGVLMYIGLETNILSNENLEYIMYGVGGVLLFVICYSNALIDSFFTTYRYKLYMHITGRQISTPNTDDTIAIDNHSTQSIHEDISEHTSESRNDNTSEIQHNGKPTNQDSTVFHAGP